MNKRIKTLLALSLALVCIATFSFSVYATGEVAQPTDAVATEAPTQAPTAAPTQAPTAAPTQAETDAPVQIETDAPVQTETEYYEPATEYVDDTQQENYVEDTDNSYTDYYTNEDGYYYYDEEEMVNSIDDSAGSVSDLTDLYDTSDIDESELKESKWDDISLSVSKKDNNTSDFSAIKENKNSEDDSQWIIYTGVILIGLSLIGILYFIIATATYKKKLKKLRAREHRQRSNSTRAKDDYGDLSEDYPSPTTYNQRYQRKRYTNSNMSYSERKNLNKANTAEINLPRGYR